MTGVDEQSGANKWPHGGHYVTYTPFESPVLLVFHKLSSKIVSRPWVKLQAVKGGWSNWKSPSWKSPPVKVSGCVNVCTDCAYASINYRHIYGWVLLIDQEESRDQKFCRSTFFILPTHNMISSWLYNMSDIANEVRFSFSEVKIYWQIGNLRPVIR
jgi:hypothetical protein